MKFWFNINKDKYIFWKLFTLLSIILWVIIMFLIFQSSKNNKTSFLNLQLNTFEGQVSSTLKTYETFSNYIYSEVVDDDFTMSILSKANTVSGQEKSELSSQLYNHLIKKYDNMTKYNFRQLHFHLPNTESFLRMHSPEKYGDILSPVRDSVRIANERQIYVTGFEEGRIYNGFRYVYPLSYNNTHIGTVEVSISSASVIGVLSELYPNEYFQFLIMESVVNDKVFIDEKSNYSASLISEDYYEDIDVVYRTKPNNIMRLDDDFYTQLKDVCLNDLGMNHSFSKVIEYNNEEYIVKFLSVKNIVNHHVGYLVSTSKTDDYKSIVNDFYKQSLFITLFTTMIIMFGWSTARNHNKLKVVSQNDQLTRIYNRHMFTELTEKELKRSNRYGYSSCILLMDIDHFKKINDTYGHNGGDQALRDLAALVSSNIRDTDIFARWGGEEFIFMLPQTDLNSGIVFAEKIRVLIENSHEGPLNDITVSIGISVVPSTCTNLKDYIDFADEAMYQAKKSGRNRVCHA